MLFENIAITGLMIVCCVTIHAVGMTGLVLFAGSDRSLPIRQGAYHWRGFAVVMTVFALLGLHALQITAYAAMYLWLGEFRDWDTALYFSGSTFTTVGYGDVVLTDERRLLAAGQGVLGLILIGWSTAILVAATTRLLGRNMPSSDPGPG